MNKKLLNGRYRLLKPLDSGGMAEVHLAEDVTRQGLPYAIKIMSTLNLDPQDRTWAIESFEREARILRGLQHPSLVKVIDFFSQGDSWYLVMDFVDGETLDARLRRSLQSRLTLPETLVITRQLCEVLEYLHANNPPVIFRDLKPANVMLLTDGNLKLIDFGIARFFRPGQTQDTANLGTPGYAAPEQYGAAQSDQRSDVYGLGVLLHQMLTGHDPVQTPFNFPPVQNLNPSLPGELQTIVQKATQMQTNLRYKTVAEMWADVRRMATLTPLNVPAASEAQKRQGALLRMRRALESGDLRRIATAYYPDVKEMYLTLSNDERYQIETALTQYPWLTITDLNIILHYSKG